MKPTTKDATLQIRLTAAELERAKKAAAKAGEESVSAWIRKMIRAATVSALLLAAFPAHALDSWTWQDTAWEVTSVGLLVADWGQTLDISNSRSNPVYSLGSVKGDTRRNETNPFLGPHPTTAAVNSYFVSAIAIHAGVSLLLPPKWRRVWQASTVGVELIVVSRNAQIGLTVRF